MTHSDNTLENRSELTEKSNLTSEFTPPLLTERTQGFICNVEELGMGQWNFEYITGVHKIPVKFDNYHGTTFKILSNFIVHEWMNLSFIGPDLEKVMLKGVKEQLLLIRGALWFNPKDIFTTHNHVTCTSTYFFGTSKIIICKGQVEFKI